MAIDSVKCFFAIKSKLSQQFVERLELASRCFGIAPRINTGRLIPQIVGPDADAAHLMQVALVTARNRVVLKWPLGASRSRYCPNRLIKSREGVFATTSSSKPSLRHISRKIARSPFAAKLTPASHAARFRRTLFLVLRLFAPAPDVLPLMLFRNASSRLITLPLSSS
jgi:putative SAM-dependent methyltransferase